MRLTPHASRLTRINRTLSSLIAGHRALLRGRNRSELFDNICHVLVETGGYRFAWISSTEPNKHSENVVSAAGFDRGQPEEKATAYTSESDPSTAFTETNRSGEEPLGHGAINVDCLYQQLHYSSAPWSSIGFPLRVNGKVLAYLNIFAEDLNGFDHDEVVLLEQMTDDLCYGLTTLMTRNERDTAQRELADTIVQRAIILESIPDIAYQIDNESKLVVWNKRMVSVTKYSGDELSNKPALEFFPKQHQQKVALAIQEVYRNGYADVKANLLTKSGDSIPYHINGTLVKNEQNQIIGITGVGRDLSEQYKIEREKTQLQRQLQQSQKMEAIGQLAGGIAHDFNNILASILGFTNLASEQCKQYDDAKLTEHLHQIQVSGTHAREIVAQILEYSRDSEINLVPVQLHSLIDDFTKILNSSMPSRIKINYRWAPDSYLIMANPVQLNQVLLNLCINARDAIYDRGEIDIKLNIRSSLEVECTSCRKMISGDYVELSVRDSGKGIQYFHIEKIFNPFFSTKEASRGSGMGLSMAHRIIHNHQGHIGVDSIPGKGSTFRLLFPRYDENLEAPCKSANRTDQSTGQPKRGRILIVDDDQSIVFFETELLEGHGFDVLAFTDSEQSFETFKRDPMCFDLLITDHTMPKMTGLELAGKVCSIRPELPVILCSGHHLDTDNDSLTAMGINTYLQKPTDIDLLLHTIEKLI